MEIDIRRWNDQKDCFIEEKISIQNGKTEVINTSHLVSNEVIILNVQMQFSKPQTMQFEISGQSIVLNFIYCNNLKTTLEAIDCEKCTIENTHNILYGNHLKGTLEIPAFEEINYLSIILKLDYYYQLINHDWAIHQKFSEKIIQKKSSYLNPEYAAFNPAIKWVLHEIKNCKFKGKLKKIYLEAKIKELLILQLDTLLVKPNHTKALFEEEEYNKLLEAKLILDNEFVNAPTLPELSRAISLNEFKLKKGFKACFETTIKSYTTKLRMEYAKKLFKNKASNVSEVAEKCGYKDASHFSAAFKLFYGFSPISFRKLNTTSKFSIYYWFFQEFSVFEFLSI